MPICCVFSMYNSRWITYYYRMIRDIKIHKSIRSDKNIVTNTHLPNYG